MCFLMTPSTAPAARHDSQAARPPQDVFVPATADVARRAYMYFENHGVTKGRDVQDWLQAEAALKAEWQLAGN